MKDISYEILDLFRQYGSSPEGIRKALDSQSGPEVLHALSDIRENLLAAGKCFRLVRAMAF